MRISLRSVSLRGRWMHFNSWKGWLYLTICVFISGRLFVGQGFATTLSSPLGKSDSVVDGSVNNVVSKHHHGDRGLKMAVTVSTWSSSRLGHGPKSQEDVITRQLHVSDKTRWLVSEEDASIKNRPPIGSSEKAVANSQDNEIDQPREDPVDGASLALERERRYWLRSERIKQVCHRRNVVTHPTVFATSKNETRPVRSPNSVNLPVSMFEEKPVTSHFSLAPTFQTMGCFLNKVASSSLVSAFLSVHGLGPTFSSPHSLTSHLLPRSLADFEFANQTYFKFMFVRHPMDRMLSCYLDKMVDSPHHSLPAFRTYVKNKARSIMNRRRQSKRDISSLKDGPKKLQLRKLLSKHEDALLWHRPDSQIIYGRRIGNDEAKVEAEETETQKLHRYVGQRQRPNPFGTSSQIVKAASANSTESKPTFQEFLEFVLDTDLQGIGYDSHWVPFHRYCSPCSVPYHVIGKLETGADDFQYVWNKTGLGSQVPVPWINRNTAPSKSKIALEEKYYSSLPRELILRFYEEFQMDFELFDYSINDILLKAGYETI